MGETEIPSAQLLGLLLPLLGGGVQTFEGLWYWVH